MHWHAPIFLFLSATYNEQPKKQVGARRVEQVESTMLVLLTFDAF